MAELLSKARHHHGVRVCILRYAAQHAAIVAVWTLAARPLQSVWIVDRWRQDCLGAQ